MSTPKRIQRKRTKGWKMPEGAVYVRIGDKDAKATIDQLKTAGFIDDEDGKLAPHDWAEHQYLSPSVDRVKRFRKKKKRECNADESLHETYDTVSGALQSGDVTPSDTEQSRAEQIARTTGPQIVPTLAGREPEPQLPHALFAAFERCRDLHPNCTDPEPALREFLRLFWQGEITEADADAIHGGMRKWLDSEVWSDGQGRYSAEWRKFSAWIGGKAWLANPAPSAAAKQAGSAGKRSSDGVDANAEWVAPWKTAGGAA